MAPVHGHGPIPFMAMAPFHSWPWRIPFMAMVLSLSHPHNCHCRTPKPLVHALAHGLRMACASTPRVFRLNRSIPGIKTCWRWGSFRGVAAVDRGDHRTSRIFKILGPKSRDLAPGAAPRAGTHLALFARVERPKLTAYWLRATIEPLSGHCRAP